MEISKYAVPFMVSMLIAAIIIVSFPSLSLFFLDWEADTHVRKNYQYHFVFGLFRRYFSQKNDGIWGDVSTPLYRRLPDAVFRSWILFDINHPQFQETRLSAITIVHSR